MTNGGQETNGPVRYFIVMLLFWTLIDTIGPGLNPKQYQQAISLSALALLAFALTSASASASLFRPLIDTIVRVATLSARIMFQIRNNISMRASPRAALVRA